MNLEGSDRPLDALIEGAEYGWRGRRAGGRFGRGCMGCPRGVRAVSKSCVAADPIPGEDYRAGPEGLLSYLPPKAGAATRPVPRRGSELSRPPLFVVLRAGNPGSFRSVPVATFLFLNAVRAAHVPRGWVFPGFLQVGRLSPPKGCPTPNGGRMWGPRSCPEGGSTGPGCGDRNFLGGW